MTHEAERQRLSGAAAFLRDEVLTPQRYTLRQAAEALSALAEHSGDRELATAAEAAQLLADPALVERIEDVASRLLVDGIPTAPEAEEI